MKNTEYVSNRDQMKSYAPACLEFMIDGNHRKKISKLSAKCKNNDLLIYLFIFVLSSLF